MFCLFNARFLSGIFIALAMSACASTPQTIHFLESPPKEITKKIELSSVQFFPQEEYQCGPAALATILSYQGVKVTSDELVNKVYLPEKKGSLQVEMVSAARSYGLLMYKLKGTIETLIREIESGNPVLVFQNLSLDIMPKWHYAVVVGYDIDKSILILHSGINKSYKISFETFERTWQRANHWAYMVLTPGKIPQTGEVLEYVKASADLAELGYTEAALQSLSSGFKKWPENTLVIMALANTKYAMNNYYKALELFELELNLRPYNDSAWNNRAYVLKALDCMTEAVRSIQCANNINPDDNNIRAGLIELESSYGADRGICKSMACPK